MHLAQFTVKAMVIAASAALALKQVMIQVEEYASFPTNTLYTVKNVRTIQSPAFTVCPKPSLTASFSSTPGNDPLKFYLNSSRINGSTFAKKFANVSVSAFDLFAHSYIGAERVGIRPLHKPAIFKKTGIDNSTVTVETIHFFRGGNWSERTFSRYPYNHYFKCFTLLVGFPIPVGSTCEDTAFHFSFRDIARRADTAEDPAQLDVFIHDQKEKFTNLALFGAVRLILLNNTSTSIVIRPEVVQQKNKKEYPCTEDDGYSYTRCMETCFWEKFQANPKVSCMIPILLTKEANLTKPECRDVKDENELLRRKFFAELNGLENQLSRDCNCPRRCHLIDYHIFVDPTPMCPVSFCAEGMARLTVSFPSKRVPHILEKEKVTLTDLLANIGGIVGVCLGISLISIFEVIERVLGIIWSKLRPRRNEIIDEVQH